MPAAHLVLAPGQRQIDLVMPHLEDPEGRADVLQRERGFQRPPHRLRREAEDLKVEIVRFGAEQTVADAAADEQRPTARGADLSRDLPDRRHLAGVGPCDPIHPFHAVPYSLFRVFASRGGDFSRHFAVIFDFFPSLCANGLAI